MSPSLVLRNLLFTILQPGVVVGLIPYLLMREEIKALALLHEPAPTLGRYRAEEDPVFQSWL